MTRSILPHKLVEFGIDVKEATELSKKVNAILINYSPEEAWHKISTEILTIKLPFTVHHFVLTHIFPTWPNELDAAPIWNPSTDFIKTTNLFHSMRNLNIDSYRNFHVWSTNHFEKFWQHAIKKINIIFKKNPNKICDLNEGIESPRWLDNAKMNIAESCFFSHSSREETAIIFQKENGTTSAFSYEKLNRLTNQVANGLVAKGFRQGDAIAIDLPMIYEAIAIYLGIIKMGGIVVSIADSFSAEEIATRLRISQAKGIFTQDFIVRDKRKFPLYEKVLAADAPFAIVLASESTVSIPLRKNDCEWNEFLVDDSTFESIALDPMAPINILFSSGTTGDPKAIVWNHTTAIKAAVDAFYHHNIKNEDIIAWPTNLGWMMGPWLIFAGLINGACIAIYEGLAKSRDFGEFIQNTQVTILGVVPTLVAYWRQSRCMEGLNWSNIKLFTSTGECSNPEDMFYLMYLGGYKPIIEYCGGTEIGGAYVTSTVVETNFPSLCSTAALGLDFILIDELGHKANVGEVALIPPSIGLSNELLNANHHLIYYKNMPKTKEGKTLRRHGDQGKRFANDYFCILGRADDTMNLGGIKISSADIERTLVGTPEVIETAAIAISGKNGGPSKLVIYVATKNKSINKTELMQYMQSRINIHLNPLFKIANIVLLDELPKTASNKIMRRVLRNKY